MRKHAWLASVLVAAAVAIPSSIWYYLGTRQIRGETEAWRQVALRAAAERSDDLATSLAVRLDEIRANESKRSYLDFWPQYLSRGETCEAYTVRRSQLATERPPPEVAAYFQIDGNGRITSPRPDTDLGAIEVDDEPGLSVDPTPEYKVALQAAVTPGLDPAMPRAEENPRYSQFRWQTGRWKKRRTLVAVRIVTTSTGTYKQGFVLNKQELGKAFKGEKAQLLPGPTKEAVDSILPIVGADWHVHVDPAPGLAEAQIRAETRQREFRQSFVAGVSSALLAGLCVLILIRRSDRISVERSRFAAAAAHELRTPLAGIQLHGEMLAHALGNPAKVQEYARRISDEAQRLSRVVTNVLNYARIEEKRLTVQKTHGDLGAALREGLAVVEPVVAQAGCTLDVKIDEPLPDVAFDRDALSHIVRNLVENAEKFTRGARDRRVEVHVRGAGENGTSRVVMVVRDHGTGVPASMRTRLFKPFARPETNAHSSGLGLGLSVVRNLAVAHGGDVRYEDAPGGGAQFTVTLPAEGHPS